MFFLQRTEGRNWTSLEVRIGGIILFLETERNEQHKKDAGGNSDTKDA